MVSNLDERLFFVNTLVYGSVMNERLTQLDWLDHGLKVLATKGSGSLKVDPLAKSLKVSRGSFYWHFQDISQFHSALIARWRERTTDEVITVVDRDIDGDNRLRRLMRTSMTGNEKLERGIRSWATQNTIAAKEVASVDKVRVDYLRALLKTAGLSSKQSSARATFIYWAYIGRVMAGNGAKHLSDEEVDNIADLLQSRDLVS